jgi:hypothetical protein
MERGRLYLIRWRRAGGKHEYYEYYVTLPADIAREWVKVSRYVVFERDPADPYALRICLVRPQRPGLGEGERA